MRKLRRRSGALAFGERVSVCAFFYGRLTSSPKASLLRFAAQTAQRAFNAQTAQAVWRARLRRARVSLRIYYSRFVASFGRDAICVRKPRRGRLMRKLHWRSGALLRSACQFAHSFTAGCRTRLGRVRCDLLRKPLWGRLMRKLHWWSGASAFGGRMSVCAFITADLSRPLDAMRFAFANRARGV